MRPGDNGHLHIITAVITIIITVARYSAVFHIKNISQDWSLTNICSATSNTNIFLITNIFFPFPLQSCAQTSHLDGWRFYHFHIINFLKMSLSSTRTFDLAQMSSQIQHFNVKTITNIDRLIDEGEFSNDEFSCTDFASPNQRYWNRTQSKLNEVDTTSHYSWKVPANYTLDPF